MASTKRVKRRRLNVKALIILLLIIYMIVMFFYYLLTMPIKNIYIKNTKYLSDNDIIEIANIKNYPSLFKTSAKSLEKKIQNLSLVSDVKVQKRIDGKLIINITEAKPLFYNRNNNKVILSNHKEVEPNINYLGIPTLVNYVPSDLLNKFIDAFANTNEDIIAMINEIVYDPDISGDIVIDNNRFLLRMNDSNLIYVNVINMKRLNDYKSVLMTIEDKKGILYLDSYNSENSLFTAFTDEEPNEDIPEE